jgi:hypothetical protein
MKRFASFFLACVLSLLLMVPLQAQVSEIVFGHLLLVSSSDTTPLVEAKAEIIDQDGKVLNSTYSDPSGMFAFYQVPYGTFHLRVLYGNKSLVPAGDAEETGAMKIVVDKAAVRLGNRLLVPGGP